MWCIYSSMGVVVEIMAVWYKGAYKVYLIIVVMGLMKRKELDRKYFCGLWVPIFFLIIRWCSPNISRWDKILNLFFGYKFSLCFSPIFSLILFP